MYRILITVSYFVFFISCSDNVKQDPLHQPPYDKLSDSIDKAPNNAELYYSRGTLLFQNEQMVFAEKDIRKAWNIDPKEEYALSLITILKEKNTDSAIAFIQEAAQKLPDNLSLQIGLARGYQQKGALDEALNVCNNIINKFPGQLDALTLKAEILKQQNKIAEALAILEDAYTFAPDDAELVHTLAFEYAEAKNAKALSLCDSLIKADIQKTHAEPNYFKGVYYSNIGNDAAAIKEFDAAISRNYYFIDAYINKGIVYYERKKYNDAIKTFGLATTVSPTYADAYYWLGKTKEAMGIKQEAKLDYQRAYGLDKTMTEAKEAAERMK
jgi:tetratricopeptide (TPR) repeat protein